MPLVGQDVEFVKQAIDCARDYADSKGVAMTVERLAVCLGVGRKQILDLIASDDESGDDTQKEIAGLLKMAYEEIAASQIEHAMARGNHSTMDVFMLKNNHNYKDKVEQELGRDRVVFVGEDSIAE